MSQFDDIFSDIGWPVFDEHVGQTVVYSDPDHQPVSLTASVSGEESNEEQGPDGTIQRKRTRTVTISTDITADSGGIADPRSVARGRSVTVTVDGEEWPVIQVCRKPGNLAELTCSTSGARRVKVGRGGGGGGGGGG